MFLRLIALLVLTASAAPAQEAEAYRDWSVLRSDQGCLASLSVGLKTADSGLATVSLYRRLETETPAIVTVRVPLGVDLTGGIAYTHPGREDAVGLAWQYCDDATCLASGALNGAEITRLQKGTRVYLGFRPLPGARMLVVPVSLLGFTRAWDAVQACG
ncbi:invasion associated locus B family protein [Pseudooceanicola sp. MF1-13]|uniref:invasion associated locus B family protein n=1 Tax=Pseudooceanicola sp. MF1-13 TaxID=3379095 RepID=UPI00389142B3